ncbi:MAG: hypothetical protein J5830_00695 [Clostridia bacterium]|nr:hypothetical protein [Clostridia bacterium]
MENSMSEMIRTSLEGISTVAGTDTVIGEPINAPGGTVIIPVSKVSIGLATGGLDYHPKSTQKNKDETKTVPSSQTKPCFGGGGGTGISVTPVCFLVITKDGRVELLNVGDPALSNPAVGVIDALASLVEKSPEIVGRLKNTLSKDGKKEPDDLDPEDLSTEKAGE